MTAARKPEIMSPAGYWPQLRTAIEAGADSVYFGLKHFTARAKVGFDLGELPEVMSTLHRRGVKGFVTFNTLVFEHEFAEAARVLAAIAKAGADAVIVQDVGILKLVREIAPALEIHASTQMSVTSADGVRLAQSLGASRVTLARELSLDEVRAIRAVPIASSKSSFTARCAWPIRANASRRKPGADAAPIADSARRPAACPTS
jgi:putative protease